VPTGGPVGITSWGLLILAIAWRMLPPHLYVWPTYSGGLLRGPGKHVRGHSVAVTVVNVSGEFVASPHELDCRHDGLRILQSMARLSFLLKLLPP
jgi:hypothetical protein